MAGLKKAGSNWVDGDRFFDREREIDILKARVRDGTHTLLTAQRRIGKTSLVRELLRRLRAEGDFETVFVDLEDATTAA
ncbi:MAG: ATP-binding protein, partial [Acidobacteria bacterium]|nr:ATP-binding protein [Acidobacteriota bacterium]